MSIQVSASLGAHSFTLYIRGLPITVSKAEAQELSDYIQFHIKASDTDRKVQEQINKLMGAYHG